MAQQPKRLYRSRTDRKLMGVLGGVAEYFRVDPSWVRIGYSLLTLFTMGFPGILLYVLLAIVVRGTPPKTEAETAEATEERES